MSFFTVFMVVVLLFSIILFFSVTRRLLNYRKKYSLPESRYTKLFGVFTPRHFMFAYIFFMAGQLIFATWIIVSV